MFWLGLVGTWLKAFSSFKHGMQVYVQMGIKIAQVCAQNLSQFKPYCHSVFVGHLVPVCSWWLVVISPVWMVLVALPILTLGGALMSGWLECYLWGVKPSVTFSGMLLWVEFIEEISDINSKRKLDFFHQQCCSFSCSKQVCYYCLEERHTGPTVGLYLWQVMHL